MSHYGTDMAFIHDEGFGQLAVRGAHELLTELGRVGLSSGSILDLGCGTGITARILTDKGYSVVGVDQSEACILIARQRAPGAVFQVGSFIDLESPSCVAVCALGEVLNYGFDDRNNRTARFAFLQRVYDTLAESGVFLLDVAGPDRAPVGSTKTFFEGEDWTVLVEVSSEGDVLSRRIVTYRRTDEHYRRDMELHKLHLISPQEVASDLRSVGFDVRQINQYDNQRLPRGLHGFMARKRSGDSRQSNVPDTLAATELGSNSVEGHGGQ